MISRKNTFFLGVFIFLIPFLGLPSSWKNALIIFSGLVLVLLSVKIVLPRKSQRVRSRKGKSTPIYVENMPITPRQNISQVEPQIDNLEKDKIAQ
jgi:hypothetical protein